MSADQKLTTRDRILGGLWGSLVGDALGVPVEFTPREILQLNPVVDMRGFGTHRQPIGTWSDDGALTLCTVDSMLRADFDPENMGKTFVEWFKNGLWTATGEVFDVGSATARSLRRIEGGTPSTQAGEDSDYSNGNGSLMRILPVALRFADEPPRTLADRLCTASKITHAHPRSQMSCVFYGLTARYLLAGYAPLDALHAAKSDFLGEFRSSSELTHFQIFFVENLWEFAEPSVPSSGYVIHTLIASIWCLLTTSSFEACVLKAVNLGGDTDTTACVAGGLAGIHYGFSAILPKWIKTVARADISGLFEQFADLCLE